MILTDRLHLVSDESLAELHAFAAGIGLKRRWYQRGHYDLFGGHVHEALQAGAVLATTRECALARRKTYDPGYG